MTIFAKKTAGSANSVHGDEFSGRHLEGSGSRLKETWQKVQGAVYGGAAGGAFFGAMMAVAHAPRGGKIAAGIGAAALGAWSGHQVHKLNVSRKEMRFLEAVNEILASVNKAEYSSEKEFCHEVLFAVTKGIGGKQKLPFDRAAMFKVVDYYDSEGAKKKMAKGVAIVNGQPNIDGFEIEINDESIGKNALIPWVVANKKPVLITDTSKTEFVFPGFEKFFNKVPKSILAVPLMSRGNVIGVMTFDNYHREKRIPKEIVNPAERLGIKVAGAIEIMRAHTTDYLTGAHNRKYLMTKLTEAVRNREETGRPFSLLMLDCDDFKSYNDQLGHPEGDRLLQRITEIAKRNLHVDDTVFRLGGDEFVVLLPKARGAETEQIAARLKGKFDELLEVTVSIGVVADDRNRNVEGLLKAVDEMLYEAKKGGKSIVVVEP